MFEPDEVRDIYWDARWDAVEMLAHALWTSIVTNWWVGPVILIVAVTATRRAWLRLFRHVSGTYMRSHI